ncbi:FKBP-type peptidyl-prolyl cis-trans isomerase [Butyrivibrio sp. XBB1001]|uniref:FKBP-type peptidyl-prolyl cis-trans isomerase n=1 Tax=Butyrivibrio sp. XBB1001 TaxID=1280682 RepID=UPI0004174994|nr:FKBP-type peptidyl-prolyl cis-trans isomerase [Butyrivibrio sp. XBB1001]
MRIAVTYDNGEVFQHFGHTESFKIYNVENDKIVSSEVISSNGQGHGALANVLAGEEVDVLICGGIGGGAHQALSDNGIKICAGASGDADKAVESFLKGELEDTGINCDHHGEGHTCGDHEDGHSCGSHDEEGGCGGCHSDEEESGCGGCHGDDEEGGCGGGCGGCSGCHSEPLFEGKNVGKTCRVHYTGTFNDGEKFDSSYDRGEPLEFVCGMGMMIHGFDKAVAEMNVGDIVDIHLTPNEAYGEFDPDAVFTLKISELPGSEGLSVGQRVYLQDMYGRPIPVLVKDKTDEEVTFDANHEMAGKDLNFKIELVEIKEA